MNSSLKFLVPGLLLFAMGMQFSTAAVSRQLASTSSKSILRDCIERAKRDHTEQECGVARITSNKGEDVKVKSTAKVSIRVKEKANASKNDENVELEAVGTVETVLTSGRCKDCRKSGQAKLSVAGGRDVEDFVDAINEEIKNHAGDLAEDLKTEVKDAKREQECEGEKDGDDFIEFTPEKRMKCLKNNLAELRGSKKEKYFAEHIEPLITDNLQSGNPSQIIFGQQVLNQFQSSIPSSRKAEMNAYSLVGQTALVDYQRQTAENNYQLGLQMAGDDPVLKQQVENQYAVDTQNLQNQMRTMSRSFMALSRNPSISTNPKVAELVKQSSNTFTQSLQSFNSTLRARQARSTQLAQSDNVNKTTDEAIQRIRNLGPRDESGKSFCDLNPGACSSLKKPNVPGKSAPATPNNNGRKAPGTRTIPATDQVQSI